MLNGAMYLYTSIQDSFTVSPQSYVNFIGSYKAILSQISSTSGG